MEKKIGEIFLNHRKLQPSALGIKGEESVTPVVKRAHHPRNSHKLQFYLPGMSTQVTSGAYLKVEDNIDSRGCLDEDGKNKEDF